MGKRLPCDEAQPATEAIKSVLEDDEFGKGEGGRKEENSRAQLLMVGEHDFPPQKGWGRVCLGVLHCQSHPGHSPITHAPGLRQCLL